MAMELRVLQYFLAVAREQNISSAAESLHLSRPTLSTQLKALEKELGKQLLIRGTKGSRKILLTEEGLGYVVCFDKLINVSGNSTLCFRPLSPKMEAEASIIWKRYQVFSKAADCFLRELNDILSISTGFR